MKLTALEIEKVLAQKEYKFELGKYTFTSYDISMNKSLFYKSYREARDENGVTDHAYLLDNLIEELGTLPTVKQYIDEGIKIAKKWWAFEAHKKKYETWNQGHLFAFEYRLATSYQSLVTEEHLQAILSELYPKGKVMAHSLLDFAIAVDVVFDWDGRRFYIHVIKDSDDARQRMARKEKKGKKVWFTTPNGQWHEYPHGRDFSKHITFEYNIEDKDKSKNVNGLALFTKEYVFEQLANAILDGQFEEVNEYTEADKFLDWLKAVYLVDENFTF